MTAIRVWGRFCGVPIVQVWFEPGLAQPPHGLCLGHTLSFPFRLSSLKMPFGLGLNLHREQLGEPRKGVWCGVVFYPSSLEQ